MMRLFFLMLICLVSGNSLAQYNWTLEKNKEGIKVYSSEIPNSDFKAIKVECTLQGNYAKLISILTDVPQFNSWIYRAKTSSLLIQNSPYDIIYHTETEMPWPLSNKDAVIHLRINRDSLPNVLLINGSSVSDLVPISDDKIRVSHYEAFWRVSMPTSQSISIQYQLKLDPGGSAPAWVANMFMSTGPFETFINLAKKLNETD